jgi:hypothetical protein
VTGSGGVTGTGGAKVVGAGGTTSSGGAIGTGGTAAGGSGGSTGGCNPSGTWASYISVAVTWPATPFILRAGEGNLQQWNLSHQTPAGVNVNSETVVCLIYIPDLQGDVLAGNATFGVRFPDNIFDAGSLPFANFVLRGQPASSGFSFQTDPFATLSGLAMPSSSTAIWPGLAALTPLLLDHDDDRKPGITVIPALGQGYSLPPIDVQASARADLIYLATRTVSSLSGSSVGCDEVRGNVVISTINGLPAIDSTIVGCRRSDGIECTAAEAAFINQNRPQFTPKGPGTLTSVRMPDSATCADIRKKFPVVR